MKVLLTFIMFFTFSVSSQASRLIEVEDYYSQKTSDFIKTRYPKRAFTVFVKVDIEGDGQNRRPAGVSERQVLNLPYMSTVNQDQVDFWSRKDLSLGTLISYLKSVYIKVDIDGQISNEEKEQFKSQLFQHLKLSPLYDKLDLSERVWSQSQDKKQRNLLLAVGGGLLCLAFVMLFFVFQTGIRTLVKGIAGPLADIGKSTENFSKQPMAGSGRVSQAFKENSSWQGEQLADNKVSAIKKQVKTCEDMFKSPNGVLLRSIEDLGSKHPFAMGAIFRELEGDTVKSLFRLGVGNWWYKAVTQPSSLNQDSAKIINVVAQMKMRLDLSEDLIDSNEDKMMLGLLLARLDHKAFGALLKGKSFEEASQILKLVPKDLMIKVSKYLYPGQWAELLQDKEVKELSKNQIDELTKKALNLCPLQNESIVNQYFVEADMAQYLDTAVTKDEREIYRALDEGSRIKAERFPFYKVFDCDKAILQTLSIEIPLSDWALVLSHCDQDEKEKIMGQMTERQYFMLAQELNQFKHAPAKIEEIIWAKKKIIEACHYYETTNSTNNSEAPLEAAA